MGTWNIVSAVHGLIVVTIMILLDPSLCIAAEPDPLLEAQMALDEKLGQGSDLGMAAGPGASAVAAFRDPIYVKQIMLSLEKTFPNLSDAYDEGNLIRKVAADPTMRGQIRGRIAESDWIARNSKDGWKPVRSPTAPQNDAYRFVNGQLEGAQVKVHANWGNYLKSMVDDNKAERFVIPDDQYDLVRGELETRIKGATRGGLFDKANEYKRQLSRLTKMGRTFKDIDATVTKAALHHNRIVKMIWGGGKSLSYIGIALALLDGGICVYEVAVGKAEVDELYIKLGKLAIGGVAAWGVGELAMTATVAAGASGAIPVAVAIVVGTVTYLAIDWAIDKVQDSIRGQSVSHEDFARIFPNGARGNPLDRAFKRPIDENQFPLK